MARQLPCSCATRRSTRPRSRVGHPNTLSGLDSHENDIAEYVQRFATKEAADAAADGDEEEGDEEMSDIGSISEDEDQTMDD